MPSHKIIRTLKLSNHSAMEVLRKLVGIIHLPLSSELIYPLNDMMTRERLCKGKWSWCASEAERLQSQEVSKVFPGQLRLSGLQCVFPPSFCLRLKGCFRSEYCNSENREASTWQKLQGIWHPILKGDDLEPVLVG